MARQLSLLKLALIGLLSLGVTACVSAEAASAQAVDLDQLDSYIERAIKEWTIPGLAIAIIKDDKVMYHFTLGYPF
jgi:CubicO group peptidase (beta-lactamase class C family)